MAQLNGRVFSRLQQYAALPMDFQQEVERLEECLTSVQSELFSAHRTLTLKSVYGIRVRPLLEKIEAWVKAYQGTSTTGAAAPVPHEPHLTEVQLSRDTAYTDPTVGAYIPRAKKLLEALVLKGFVTPEKEDKLDETSSAIEDLELKDSDLLVAVGKRIVVPKNATPTVWDLADGAVFAGMVKRKAGFLEPLVHGKSEYAIVNARLKNLTFFGTDVGREPKLQLPVHSLRVAFDERRYENGVNLWNEDGAELVNAASERESDALVHALLAVGATHDKLNTVHTKTPLEQVRREVKKVVDKTTHGPEAQMGTSDTGSAQRPLLDTHHQGVLHVTDNTESPQTGVGVTHPQGRIMDLTHGHNNPHNLDLRAEEMANDTPSKGHHHGQAEGKMLKTEGRTASPTNQRTYAP